MAEQIGMLKKFRRRFILMTMALVGVVALVAFAGLGLADYQSTRSEIGTTLTKGTQPSIDRVLSGDLSGQDDDASSESDDANSDGKDSDNDDGTGAGTEKARVVHSISMTTAFVRYTDLGSYTVGYNGLLLDTDTLEGAVKEAIENTQSDTQANRHEMLELSDYGLFYKIDSAQSGYNIAFVSTSDLWDHVFSNIMRLVGMWLLLMVAVFVITFFMSRYVARPVERAWKDQQRFIADASHELKTPLTVIMADVSILKEAPEKTVREQSNWVEGISNEAERMKQLTEDLLTLAQADAGVDMKQIMGDVDLSSVVEGQVLQFDAVAFERGLTIQDEVQESLHVTGDQIRLENMVKTLLENACKYARQPGSIDVRLSADRGNAVLSIHNDGDPIPPEDLPHLFDRFYRSDKARVHEGETASFGLGLSIAKSTVELHNGTIGVASDEGGTTFTVKIPLAKTQR